MSLMAKMGHWFPQIGRFVSDEPARPTPKGGVFPAIFGTVFMVILMAIMVTPLGVVAGLPARVRGQEQPDQDHPHRGDQSGGRASIVYGVFGLGWSVYALGGSLDRLFYPEALPSPPSGSPASSGRP